MNEDLHVEKAARLVDKPGAENLATDRARDFVAQALISKKEKTWHPVLAWGCAAMAIAACVAVAIVIFRPSSQEGHIPGYGISGQILENQSIHAETENLDSINTVSSDTLTVESIIYPEQ